MIKLIYFIVLAICGAVLVHIAIVYLIPRFDRPLVTKQLELLSQSRDPLILIGKAENPGLSGLDPLFQYRVCLFDLETSEFQLVSIGDVPFFSATLIAENGAVAFSITDRQTINRTLNIEVRAASEQQSLFQSIPENDSQTGAVTVYVSALKGYAIVRAFVPDQSWDEIASKFLNDIVCQSVETAN